MTILVDKKKKLFTLQTKNTTYQMKVGKFDHLYHIYYGKRIDHQDLSYLMYNGPSHYVPYPHEAKNRVGSLTLLSQEYPTVGTGDLGSVALDLENYDGTRVVDLKYKNIEVINGKYSLEKLPTFYANNGEAQTLKITLVDDLTGIEVELFYGVFGNNDVITRAARMSNLGKKPIKIHKMQSMSLDLIFGQYDLVHFHGRWGAERNYERLPLSHNVTSFGSNYGVSSSKENPGFLLVGKNTNETDGYCYGFNLVYSGNFRATAEQGALGQSRVTLGLGDDQFSWKLEPGELFESPEAVMSFSGYGMTNLSHNFHDVIRNNLCRSKYEKARRPVLVNNWEATEFDFTGKKLLQIAKAAKGIGADLFVMDDGWFGNRYDDNRALGDWFVNEKKLGCSLNELVKKINAMGLDFGMWFEPEMISEDSELYRHHPDWALNFPQRKALLDRNQLVLDLSREEVRDYLFERISAVLDSANVSYIKWDMNRPITDWYSKNLTKGRQGELQHRYILGLYELFGRVTRKYPDVLIEGCSAGGARFDLGMLSYEPQIWTSDNTDPINRLGIQYGTSFFYPVSAMGSHISDSPNQQNGRVTPFSTRAAVAMCGTFGYELDITKFSDEQKEQAKKYTKLYKKVQDMTCNGDYYRLASPFDRSNDLVAWQVVSKDKSESFLTVVVTNVVANASFVYVQLRGLEASDNYEVNGEIYSGAALMNAGLKLGRFKGDYPSQQIYIKEV
ncbi:alpha-galactosidase [Lactobacillus halodurans]|uniref:Alpha-galactosidase n=1 Tax=Companilactobacillus halodurans TaxID=2584183 RepID=A0A5P0ZPU7_9LACO|nr:alpha-galactosidase [Companilactobacillus halodurans]MQS76236.1 alpha-galactosidase [Companilactobacillus halodurans]